MPGVYGGLVVIMMYAATEQASEPDALMTQNNLFIFTQSSQEILVQE